MLLHEDSKKICTIQVEIDKNEIKIFKNWFYELSRSSKMIIQLVTNKCECKERKNTIKDVTNRHFLKKLQKNDEKGGKIFFKNPFHQ